MKKAISLLLVLAAVLSMSSIAFAATDIPGTYTFPDTTTHNAANYNAANNDTATRNAAGRNATTYSDTDINPAAGGITTFMAPLPLATPGATQTYNIDQGELLLVDGNRMVGVDTELRPDETYKFDIYYADRQFRGETEASIFADTTNFRKLTKTDVGTGTVRVRTMKGSSVIQSAKIKNAGTGAFQTYRFEIETRANYGTKTTDVEYTLSVLSPSTSKTFHDTPHTFVVGFGLFNDSTDIGEDGIVTITNDNPVITKDMFTEMAKSANYKNVIFEADDGNWVFKGKIAGMKDTNFSYNYNPDTDLINKFPEYEFKFLSFPGGVQFPTTGEMRIDVSDVSSDFRTMYPYLYRDGRLTEINATYDSGADEIVFRTNYLGKFVISNAPITDTSIVDEEREEPIEEEEEEYYPVPPTTHNPGTGAAGSANTMMLFGLATLASAAVVSKKRK